MASASQLLRRRVDELVARRLADGETPDQIREVLGRSYNQMTVAASLRAAARQSVTA